MIAAVPGAVGFLVWELKSNWDLYASNRPATLRPVLVGHHGETMGALLRPGFHSGTVPKLYARMRRALRHGASAASRYRQQLREVEHAVARGPAQAGPLNSHALVLRSLERLRELSPAYLRRFLGHVETLQWLQDARALAAPAKAAPRKRAKK